MSTQAEDRWRFQQLGFTSDRLDLSFFLGQSIISYALLAAASASTTLTAIANDDEWSIEITMRRRTLSIDAALLHRRLNWTDNGNIEIGFFHSSVAHTSMTTNKAIHLYQRSESEKQILQLFDAINHKSFGAHNTLRIVKRAPQTWRGIARDGKSKHLKSSKEEEKKTFFVSFLLSLWKRLGVSVQLLHIYLRRLSCPFSQCVDDDYLIYIFFFFFFSVHLFRLRCSAAAKRIISLSRQCLSGLSALLIRSRNIHTHRRIHRFNLIEVNPIGISHAANSEMRASCTPTGFPKWAIRSTDAKCHLLEILLIFFARVRFPSVCSEFGI